MLQFWSVNYICQVCKLYFYFGHVRNFGQYLYLSVFSKQWKCTTFSFCEICCIAILLKTVFFGTFWRLKILVLWQKIVENLLIFVYLFFPKNSTTDFTKTFITQEWLVVESCPTHCWIAFLMLYRLVFNIHSHFNEPILAWSFWFYRNYIFFKNFVIERSEFLKKSSYAESVCLKMIMPFHFISGRAF